MYEHDDAGHTYTYDAEGKVLSVDGGSTASYSYDALDRRIQATVSGTSNEFIFDPFGRRIASFLANGNVGNEARVYMDGSLFATRDWTGSTFFHHADWQGTERIRTDYQGQTANVQRSLAFGDGFSQFNDPYAASQDNAQFTGQEYDAETNTDHFQFRQYQRTQGRWMSPDPYDGSYDLGNPQSFNRYAYVLNNPFSLTDPDGRCGLITSNVYDSSGNILGSSYSYDYSGCPVPWFLSEYGAPNGYSLLCQSGRLRDSLPDTQLYSIITAAITYIDPFTWGFIYLTPSPI